MLLLLAPYLLVARPAHAQIGGPLTVYVLDFNNETTVGGQLLGRVAAAQMSLQLTESANWDVVPDAQVQKRIQDLNLKPPFDRIARAQIAQGIDADAVVYGKIKEVRVSGGPNPQAFVHVNVIVEDITTGSLINGAMVEGLSTPRMGFTGDSDILIEEALGKAAFRARERMDRFRLPEGTVLNTTVVGTVDNPELDALINIGARQGVRRGMEMIVTRQKQPVGTLKVTSVDSDISTGRVTSNQQGVKPEDRVRAIFSFADFPLTRSIIRSAAPVTQGERSATAAKPATASEPTGNTGERRKPAADLPRIARATKAEGAFEQFKAPPDAYVALEDVTPPPPVVVDEPGVEAAKDTLRHGSFQRLVGGGALRMMVGGALVLGLLAVGGRGGEDSTRPYEIEAFGFQFGIGAPGAFIKVKWSRPKSIVSSAVLGYVIWRIDPVNVQPIVVGGLDGDSIREFLDSEQQRTFNAYNGIPGAVPTAAGAGTRAAFTAPGIVAGTEYRYQVSTAYEVVLEDRNQDGTPDTQETAMSPLSMSSPWVTAITPPTISAIDNLPPSSDQQVNPDLVTVEWQQTAGADTYLIWVATDPNFHNKTIFGPFTTVPTNQGGPTTVSRQITLRGSLRRNQTLFISVGARHSTDHIRPRPFGAIFSIPVTVKPEVTPPPPPGGEEPPPAPASKGQRNDSGSHRFNGRPGGGVIQPDAAPKKSK